MGRVQTIIGVVMLPLLWWVSVDVLRLSNLLLFPTFGSVVLRLGSIVQSGTLEADLAATLYRWVSGFALGVVSGILAGLILGSSPTLRRIFEFPVEFFRSMPVTAIFPLFLIVFGIGDASKIAMAFLPSFLLMTVNTSYGVTLADPTRRRMAKVFGATPAQIFFKIVSMDALPQIFVGLRLALAQSLIVAIVAEMFIGTDQGLGQRIYDSYLTNSITTLYALLIVVGVLGYAMNRALVLVEARIIFWTGK